MAERIRAKRTLALIARFNWSPESLAGRSLITSQMKWRDLVARTPKLCGADIAFLAANGVAIVQTGRKILAASSKFIGRHPFIEEVEFIIGRPDCGSLPREVDLDVSDYMLGLPQQLEEVLLMGFVIGQ